MQLDHPVGPLGDVVLVGAGFIAFTILNSLVRLGVRLTVIELAPTILPRMIDATSAARSGEKVFNIFPIPVSLLRTASIVNCS